MNEQTLGLLGIEQVLPNSLIFWEKAKMNLRLNSSILSQVLRFREIYLFSAPSLALDVSFTHTFSNQIDQIDLNHKKNYPFVP